MLFVMISITYSQYTALVFVTISTFFISSYDFLPLSKKISMIYVCHNIFAHHIITTICTIPIYLLNTKKDCRTSRLHNPFSLCFLSAFHTIFFLFLLSWCYQLMNWISHCWEFTFIFCHYISFYHFFIIVKIPSEFI